MSLVASARAMGRTFGSMAFGLGAALALTGAMAASPQALAQASPAPVAATPAAAAPVAPVAVTEPTAAKAAAPAAIVNSAADADAYVPAKPVADVGQPTAKAYGFQTQFSPVGHEALAMHNAILMPIIVAISLFVLGLMLYVMVRFRRARNPVASKNAHNTVIEVVWTLLPVLILVFVAVPSIRLLAAQYKAPPKNALTIKATGYQWYWGYTYPDNGGFEVVSNMLTPEEALKRGEPRQLGADKRMVVPYGEPIRMQTTGSDVIHSFAMPSLWFKLDAVPGKINERLLFIEKPGVYYGQCSELCGARHAFMPIVIEAVSRPVFNSWLKANGGTVASSKDAKPGTAAPVVAPAAAPAADASAKPST
ncbi:MAG: cytochrome c oxidase subunit II [Novosphingobium sp.]|nr:cytochrome c oxidase subunit II [Novosphingobium sp.]